MGFLRRNLKLKFRQERFAPTLQSPVLFLHGAKDGVVPVEHAQRLFEARAVEKSGQGNASSGVAMNEFLMLPEVCVFLSRNCLLRIFFHLAS